MLSDPPVGTREDIRRHLFSWLAGLGLRDGIGQESTLSETEARTVAVTPSAAVAAYIELHPDAIPHVQFLYNCVHNCSGWNLKLDASKWHATCSRLGSPRRETSSFSGDSLTVQYSTPTESAHCGEAAHCCAYSTETGPSQS